VAPSGEAPESNDRIILIDRTHVVDRGGRDDVANGMVITAMARR